MTSPADLSGSRPRHWPALDGIRAVAVLLVLLYHFFQRGFFPAGYLGVDIFFVLSGFLITWGLIEEWDRHDRVSLARFYARRALRLLPAAVAVMVVAFVLAVASLPTAESHQTLAGLPWVLLYSGNWARALSIQSLGILDHLWSLAVEEQFYLLWPAVGVWMLSRRTSRSRLAGCLALLAIAETAYREVLFHYGYPTARLAFGLDTHSDGLLAGAAVAFALSAGLLGRAPGWVWAPVVSLAVGLVAVLVATGDAVRSFQWSYPLTAVGTAATVAALVASRSGQLGLIQGVLESRPAVWTGRRSYGLYVWCIPVYYGLPWPARFIGAPRYFCEIVLLFVVAAASYRFLELPFLRLKRRLRWPSDRVKAPAEIRRGTPAVGR